MKTKMLCIVAGLLITVVINNSIFAQTSAHYRIQSSTLGAVGGALSSISYKVKSTLGQTTPPIDTAYPPQSTSYKLNAGFWYTLQNDRDGDGVNDNEDNCPNTPNGPLLGTCSATSDKPLVPCTSNADCVIGCSNNGECQKNQEDSDNDGIGDVCDYCEGSGAQDSDRDGYCDGEDNCPTVCNSQQLDADNDGIGDVCDPTPGCGGCGQPECEQQC